MSLEIIEGGRAIAENTAEVRRILKYTLQFLSFTRNCASWEQDNRNRDALKRAALMGVLSFPPYYYGDNPNQADAFYLADWCRLILAPLPPNDV